MKISIEKLNWDQQKKICSVKISGLPEFEVVCENNNGIKSISYNELIQEFMIHNSGIAKQFHDIIWASRKTNIATPIEFNI